MIHVWPSRCHALRGPLSSLRCDVQGVRLEEIFAKSQQRCWILTFEITPPSHGRWEFLTRDLEERDERKRYWLQRLACFIRTKLTMCERVGFQKHGRWGFLTRDSEERDGRKRYWLRRLARFTSTPSFYHPSLLKVFLSENPT